MAYSSFHQKDDVNPTIVEYLHARYSKETPNARSQTSTVHEIFACCLSQPQSGDK